MPPAYAGAHPATRRVYAAEMGSYAGQKHQPRWLWWVEDVDTGHVVAYVSGQRTPATVERLRQLLTQLGLSGARCITASWWAYVDRLPAEQRGEDTAQRQGLERKHLTLRTRLKRRTRKIICFSKNTFFQDGVMALLIHHFFFQATHST